LPPAEELLLDHARLLKEIFAMAAERLRSPGPDWEIRATVLASASAHWLRHTAGSHMTDQQVDLRFVRDNFGHASIATTSAYLHTEDDARHEATQVLQIAISANGDLKFRKCGCQPG
jgi:integrase